jgi:hypothetical protein
LKAATAIRPITTVLPDVLLDTDRTINECSVAYPFWVDAFQHAQLKPAFMIVPQGKTREGWIRCAEHFASDDVFPYINFWGIPRNVVQQFGTRVGLPSICRALNPNRKIHLLGFSDEPFDDIQTAQIHNNVYGIDSAVPFRAINQGIPLTIAGFSNMPKRGDWWETAEFSPRHVIASKMMNNWFRRS